MEAKELRIGNLVLLKERQLIKIETILEFGVNKWSELGAHGFIKFSELSPIPLTEEWLVKFEFKADEDTKEYYKDLFGVAIDHEFKGIKCPLPLHIWDCSFTDAPIQYVHQLQNLYFSLTGKELPIK